MLLGIRLENQHCSEPLRFISLVKKHYTFTSFPTFPTFPTLTTGYLKRFENAYRALIEGLSQTNDSSCT